MQFPKTLPILLAMSWISAAAGGEEIDRHALVSRHDVTVTAPVPRSVMQVGNGEFAFGVDVTGLQSTAGNTMAQWAWHTAPLPPGTQPGDLKLADFDTHGRAVGYATSAAGQGPIYNWLRENPHRFNLGRLRLLLDGKPVAADQVKSVRQRLDLWSGIVTSAYTLDGQPVRVETCALPDRDGVAMRIESPLLEARRLGIELAFPFADPGVAGGVWNKPDAHTTTLAQDGDGSAELARQLDGDRYFVKLKWAGGAKLREEAKHIYRLEKSGTGPAVELVCEFSQERDARPLAGFPEARKAAAEHWAAFWNSGGAIDLSASKDPRWRELERRIVLSQYLLAVNEAGSLPPQESGLFNNGWNGKFHLEMHWWHGAHYALWDRWPLFERSLGWYFKIVPSATERARSQGYAGLRWPKMAGPGGTDAPSPTGPLLIWQQPHPIFYAELDYRLHPTRTTLEKWAPLIAGTADFMASFAFPDPASGKFVLGPPMKTVPENTDPKLTRNPALELSYWRTGLRLAQAWRARMGLPPEVKWQTVLDGLAPLPVAGGLYLQQEGMTDTYTEKNWEHPSLVGPLGMLPGDGVDPAVMRATVRKVMAMWKWDRVWGWDFPMMAMAAARNGEPAMAVDALLMDSPRNGMNKLGLSNGGPFPYFPSNGGLLYATALMAAGWDGAPAGNAPGFPQDGSWTVKWEGLRKAP